MRTLDSSPDGPRLVPWRELARDGAAGTHRGPDPNADPGDQQDVLRPREEHGDFVGGADDHPTRMRRQSIEISYRSVRQTSGAGSFPNKKARRRAVLLFDSGRNSYELPFTVRSLLGMK